MIRQFSSEQTQLDRAQVLARVSRKEISLKDAAQLLSISYRQAKRLLKRFRSLGPPALSHAARGKASNRAFDPTTKQAILARYRDRYPDFGPTFAAEKLLLDGFQLDHETLRRWLIQEGLWHSHRKRSLHRSWRQRRAHFGEMVQMDGSFHLWFESRAPSCCLMNMVDDATGVTLALFSEEETTEAAMTLLWKWSESFGIPLSLYTDRKNVYVPAEEVAQKAALEGGKAVTQFGRACEKLNIRMIKAHSPQAKGRVERSNGTYQDRLVKELRLAEISDIAAANEFLYGGFLQHLNAKFAVAAREETDYHRSAKEVELAAIFCLQEERGVSRDWVVRYENRFYQLKRQSGYAPAAGKVEVRKYLNGEMHMVYRGEEVAYEEMAARPVGAGKPEATGRARRVYKPGPDHPWKKSWR